MKPIILHPIKWPRQKKIKFRRGGSIPVGLAKVAGSMRTGWYGSHKSRRNWNASQSLAGSFDDHLRDLRALGEECRNRKATKK